MKLKFFFTASLLSTALPALAVDNLGVHYPNITNYSAFYVRAEAGYQLVNTNAVGGFNIPAFAAGTLTPSIVPDTNKSQGFMGRAAIGYGFKYFALESGFAWLAPVYRNFSGFNYNQNSISANLTPGQTQTNVYVIDLLGKLLLTYESYYTFLGGGAAYVHGQFSTFNTYLNYSAPGTNTTTTIPLWHGSTTGFISPKVIIGAGYNFSHHWTLDASYYYIFSGGDDAANGSYLPDLSAVTLNVMYKF